MSEEYFHQSRTATLRGWALGQMLSGAGWGALFVVGIGAILGVIYGVSLLLPEESKQAPSPYGMIIEQPAQTVLA
jgi:hypothetical protein